MAAVAAPLFVALASIPCRTRVLSPDRFPACVRELLSRLNKRHRTLRDVVYELCTSYSLIDEDEFHAAKAELLAGVLLANQSDILYRLYTADGYESLGALIKDDPVWIARYAPNEDEETVEDVQWQAAVAVAVILLAEAMEQ